MPMTSRVEDLANPRPRGLHNKADGWRRLRVELVYPPFGPAALPSLGLALLSALVKQEGHICTTHYWNLDLVAEMPFRSVREQMTAYRTLTERTWYPYNEWTFGGVLFGEAMSERDQITSVKLMNHTLALPDELLSAEALLQLRSDAPRIVVEAAERLADADVVGVSTTFFQNVPALALAQEVKRRWPQKRVVLGGANCDAEMGAALFRKFTFLDAVFVGEADWTFVPYLESIAANRTPENIPGVLWRDEFGAPHGDSQGSPTFALDTLPHADYFDWLAERERVGVASVAPLVVALESSRGCWWGAKHHCTFCGLNATGMAYRQKSADRLVAEVRDVLATTHAEFVYMTDNILSMDYVSELPGWPGRIGRPAHFFYEVKANLRGDQLRRLAAAGVAAVQPGIESLSTEALALMRKGVTAIQNVAFLRSAQEVGIRPVWNLLVGFPGEDPDWYRAIVDQIPRLTHLRPPVTVAQVEFHRFSPYHNDPASFGLSLRPLDAYEALYPFDEDELSELAYTFRRDDEYDQRKLRSYMDPLGDAVVTWRAAFHEQSARLTTDDDGHDVVIHDTRPAYGPRTLRLHGLAARLYRCLTEPRSLSALVAEAEARGGAMRGFGNAELIDAFARRPNELPIGFGVDEFLQAPESCMAVMVDAGLLYEERGRRQPLYLALGVSASARPTIDVWADSGV